MRMDPKSIILADGQEIIIRSADRRDAAAVCEHIMTAARETPYLIQTPQEAGTSRTAQARFLRSRQRAAGRISLCAFSGGQLAGMATVSPYGEFFRTAHRGTMSISLKRAFWGKGIASALMEEIMNFARFCGYSQLELSADAENTRAIRLYKRFGFTECGRIPSALKQVDGSFSDELMMIKMLK